MRVHCGPKSETLQQQCPTGWLGWSCFGLFFFVWCVPLPFRKRITFPLSVFIEKNNSDHTSTKIKGLEIRRLVFCWWVTDDACWKCVTFHFTISGELKICPSKCKIMNWQSLECVQRQVQVLWGLQLIQSGQSSFKGACNVPETKLGTRPWKEPMQWRAPKLHLHSLHSKSPSVHNIIAPQLLASTAGMVKSATGWPWSRKQIQGLAVAISPPMAFPDWGWGRYHWNII